MKSIYAFEDADSKNRMLLGGKGAGLSEMTRLKLPVPPGFTITTEVCNKYYENKKNKEKLLENGDKWETALAENIKADAPYR